MSRAVRGGLTTRFQGYDAMQTLTTRQLALAYDGKMIVDALDLEIPPGQITALVGPNGCGKSTLLRGLSRLLKPRNGTVLECLSISSH